MKMSDAAKLSTPSVFLVLQVLRGGSVFGNAAVALSCPDRRGKIGREE